MDQVTKALQKGDPTEAKDRETRVRYGTFPSRVYVRDQGVTARDLSVQTQDIMGRASSGLTREFRNTRDARGSIPPMRPGSRSAMAGTDVHAVLVRTTLRRCGGRISRRRHCPSELPHTPALPNQIQTNAIFPAHTLRRFRSTAFDFALYRRVWRCPELN
eukprot:1221163-Rhodomonas_salina.2